MQQAVILFRVTDKDQQIGTKINGNPASLSEEVVFIGYGKTDIVKAVMALKFRGNSVKALLNNAVIYAKMGIPVLHLIFV
jgi:hypothetical protein